MSKWVLFLCSTVGTTECLLHYIVHRKHRTAEQPTQADNRRGRQGTWRLPGLFPCSLARAVKWLRDDEGRSILSVLNSGEVGSLGSVHGVGYANVSKGFDKRESQTDLRRLEKMVMRSDARKLQKTIEHLY